MCMSLEAILKLPNQLFGDRTRHLTFDDPYALDDYSHEVSARRSEAILCKRAYNNLDLALSQLAKAGLIEKIPDDNPMSDVQFEWTDSPGDQPFIISKHDGSAILPGDQNFMNYAFN